MQVMFECMYCGFSWTKNIYNNKTIESESCHKCKDSNIKAYDLSKKNDTYAGSPPFPEKKVDDQSGTGWNGD